MPSLVSIQEGEVLATPSHQSSYNSKDSEKNSKAQSSSESQKTGATNSKAESSTGSQKTRATARSKLMEEAKRIGEDLRALRPNFDRTNNRFSENVREGNKDTFDAWQFLFADVHNCTGWLPESRSNMNLRLQNPPGKRCMFQVVPRMVFLTQFYSNDSLERTLRAIHKGSQAAAEWPPRALWLCTALGLARGSKGCSHPLSSSSQCKRSPIDHTASCFPPLPTRNIQAPANEWNYGSPNCCLGTLF